MPDVENISVRSTTKKPNGVILGSITNNSGVLSNFGADARFEVIDGKKANATYVFKFTTPSSLATVSMTVCHSEYWEAIELITGGQLSTWNWETNSSVTFFTPSLSTTYWVKSVHNGTDTTYYYSTNGTSYTLITTVSDNTRTTTKDYPFMIGNGSRTELYNRPWTGSIDLNGCYIEVGGAKVWEGMDYNDIQKIGGNEFDGQWVLTDGTMSNSFTLAAGATKTFSLSSYLPNDGYDYEVIFEASTQTGTTSGNYVEERIYSGTGTSGIMTRVGRVRTRASNWQFASVVAILPIKSSDKNVTVNTYSGSSGTATLGLWAKGYRRIGKNGTGSDYISSINYSGVDYALTGKYLNGDWVGGSHSLFSSTLAQSGSSTLDLSSYLPADGYSYEVMFSVTAITNTTSGNTVSIRFGADSGNNNPVVCKQVTRTSSNMICGGNTIVPVASRKVYLYNNGNSTSGTINVNMRAYRRIGTNG